MTEIYGLFDAADPLDPDRVYTSEAFARLFRTIMRDGIVHNDGDELAVSPTVPAAMSVDVGTGMALVQGRYYINSADLTLTVEAADPSYPRIDRVVVRADLVGRTVHAVVKKGTAAASPVAPALTRTAETWELSLAQVRVEAGATSIVAAKITDERANASLCGVAAPAYVPSSQLEVVGAVDMQGKALTGLPAPSAATDAARRNMGGATLQGLGTPSAATDAATKAYVDGKVAGFGISQIAIDADKNWGGKNITNVGTLSANALANTIRLTASDSVRLSNSTPIAYAGVGMRAFKIPNSVVPGSTIRVRANATHNFIVGNPGDDRSLYCSGGPEGTIVVIPGKNTNWTNTGTKDIIVNPGNILSFTMGGWNTGLTLNSVEIKYDCEYNFDPITWV